MDASHDGFAPPIGPLSKPIGGGMAIHRPTCDAGVASPCSTSPKRGSDDELTAEGLHPVLSRCRRTTRRAAG